MFQESDDTIAHDVATKLDRAAATQRSTIRRQPTVRPVRNTNWSSEEFRRRVHAELQLDRDDESNRDSDRRIAQMQVDIERLRSERRRRAEALNGDSLRRQARSNNFDHNSGDDSDRASARPLSPSRRLPRPNRESNLRFEIGASRSSSVSPRRLRLLSPPSSSDSNRRRPPWSDASANQSLPEPGNLTPGFAPAMIHHGRDSRAPDTPPPETWESTLPPLDRMSRAPFAPPQRSYRTIDGLGDRHRSPSADAAAEEETWANLLTSMGAGRSSTTTSFASNGDSSSRSRDSQATMATSFGEIGTEDTCDLDLAPGITEDIAREIREQHRQRERQQRRNGEPDGPIMTGAQGLRMHQERLERARRSEWAGGLTPPSLEDFDARHSQSESEQARAPSSRLLSRARAVQDIFERYGSRGSVPDEWWAVWFDEYLTPEYGDTVDSPRPRRDGLRQAVDGARDYHERQRDSLRSRLRFADSYTQLQQLEQAEEVMQSLRSSQEAQQEEAAVARDDII
jgi:hypothetical protein